MCYQTYKKELYGRYAAEAARLGLCEARSAEAFDAEIGAQLSRMDYVALEDGRGRGVLFYSVWQAEGQQVCDVPVYGYYADTEQAATRLFCLLAQRVLQDGSTLFQIHLYAHDEAALRLFCLLQFGCMAETGLCRLPAAPCEESAAIRPLRKEEIAARWAEIWGLTHAIVQHLQQPPVFYPGNEFTEDAYKAFFLEESTCLYAAFSPQGQIVGIIEANREADWFVSGGAKSINVGEAYVLPAYRGTGLARKLLLAAAAAARQQGAQYLWVTHGTANPQARGFWNKFFSAYQYELVRKIDPIVP